jgi:hypothetical protein
LFHTDRANHAWNAGSASYFPIVNGWYNRNDAINSSGYLFHAYNGRHGHTISDAVRTTSYLIHVRFPRLDRTGAAAARNTSSAVAFHCCNARTDVIDGTEPSLHIHDDASDIVGNHSHANRHHHDREHLANDPARQFLDHRMQFYAGRPADQRRGFAALNAGNTAESAAGHDSAGGSSVGRH